MKKVICIVAMAIAITSCNKSPEAVEAKTACIDTAKLMKEYTEAKDLEAKYKTKAEEIGRKLDVEEANFKADVAYFQKNSQANGQAWAQQKGAELQKRQQELQYGAQQLDQQLRQEQGTEMDTLVKSVKKFVATYGKDNGYSYIYVSGDGGALLYSQEKYDITDKIVKLLNDKYSADGKKEDKTLGDKEVKK